jgi:hypothetical protein
MTGDAQNYRYQMVNVRPGYVIIEQERFTHAERAWFSAEDVPPKEEYREGDKVWKYSDMAQSFQFDVRDNDTGEVAQFPELLGLLYAGCCKKNSDIYTIGDLASRNRISLYIAITYEAPDGSRLNISMEKIQMLNAMYNERLHTRDKKILILPDLFNLYRAVAYGDIMIDFGLTSTEG